MAITATPKVSGPTAVAKPGDGKGVYTTDTSPQALGVALRALAQLLIGQSNNPLVKRSTPPTSTRRLKKYS